MAQVKDDLWKLRHTCEHVLTQAMQELYGAENIIPAMGPATKEGFYFDFDTAEGFSISEKNFEEIEAKMKEITKKNLPMIYKEVSADEAIELFQDNPYKMEWIEGIKERGETASIYWTGDEFVDLCAGPHTESTGKIRAFKLMSIAGAYWHGDEKNKMLTRIYGTAFADRKELKRYTLMLAEAKKRDHRKLGKELEIFAFDNEVGQGLPLWLPRGTAIADRIEDLARAKEREHGYKQVRTPHIAKEDLYLRSGHLPYYKESMFPSMELDNETYYLKAMNCPHHHKIYGATPKSYRDLPIRLAEYGQCYRYEDSGSLFGLMRVRSLSMNDAHIYCTEEQFESEFLKVIDLYKYYFDIFGIEKFQMRLSKHSKEGLGKKYVDNEALWIKTEEQVRQALIQSEIPFVEEDDEAAFYGPKIDVQIWSAIGREFTLATNQLDFAVPERFNLTYTDSDGTEKTPICIHRAPLSTHERFIGFLIEHFAGAFPLWLAPEQIRIIPVIDKHYDYAYELQKIFFEAGFNVEVDASNESLGKRIRNAEKMKIPRMFVIGDKELEQRTVAVRNYFTKEQVEKTIEETLEHLQMMCSEKTIEEKKK